MQSDQQIHTQVSAELNWDSRLKESNITVEVLNGHVILTGSVHSLPNKIHAEEAARRIAGVKSVNNELKVILPEASKRSDEEIVKCFKESIKWNSSIDESKIRIVVENGWVTLEGEVDWEYKRAKARAIAEDLTGVTGVTNLITLVAYATADNVKENIEAALERNQFLNNHKIDVEVSGNKVTLSGMVGTLGEKQAAETAAWSSPGVNQVVNEIYVDYSEAMPQRRWRQVR
jgi:osmotically-inducible protein OsmY